MKPHQVVSAPEWVRARKELLAKEKEHMRAADALAEARRALPWERVDKSYVFDGPSGDETLGDLFAGRSQLVVYHFMFAPEWEAGCHGCSFWADSFDGVVTHLAQRDVTLVAVSRAPLAKLVAYEKRLGWSFKWVSSGRCDFNFDYGVSFDAGREGAASYNYAPKKDSGAERPGTSVFFRDGAGAIFHTYSTYARGLDVTNAAYRYLDLVPKGRDEDGLPFAMSWVRRRDEYDAAG
jgi:predicted dithiol-disulfide oxidoreductase (DUF899 family)